MSAASAESRSSLLSDLAVVTRRRIACLLAAGMLAPLGLTGCGHKDVVVPVHPVSGKVTFEGKPAEGAVVTLNPQGDAALKTAAPKATVKPDGSFKVSVYSDGDGAPAGDYVATVQWFKMVGEGAGPNVIPAKYSKPDTSPLKITVKEGQNDLPIEIAK
jgi:hypothetical protein